jgi:hypothetical protein
VAVSDASQPQYSRQDTSASLARRRRAIVVALTVLATTLVLFAFCASLGNYWPVVLAVPVAVVTALGMRGRGIPDAPTPSLGVFALATATLLFSIVALAFVSWLVYWLLMGCLYALDLTPVDLDEDVIAGWIAPAWLAGLMLGYAPTAARELATGLYPSAGVHSRYVDVTRFKRSALLLRGAVAVVAIGVVIAIAYYGDLPGEDYGTALLVGLLILVSLFATPESTARPGAAAGSDVTDGVARELGEQGWTVLQRPQTGEAAIDPLLAEVDLFAHNGERALLVEVKAKSAGATPAQWAACTGLLTAAKALHRGVLPPEVASVDPVMVLVDIDLQPAIDGFARSHGMALVVVDTATGDIHVKGKQPLRGELEAMVRAAVADGSRPRDEPDESNQGAAS